MTKLFSLKSLAFAGAAAFALTLAAAPQADAAEKLTLDVSNLAKVKVTDATQLTSTEDGKVLYYQLAKNEDSVKPNKYVAITDENLGYYNLSKFAGKAKYLSVSADGTDATATGVAIKAAPKLKAKYTVADGLVLTIDGKTAEVTSKAGVDVTATAEGKTYKVNGVNADLIKSTGVLGGTIEVTVKEVGATDGIASESKVAKLKISAKAKAPKISLKLAATKKFEWKISDKQEYRITAGSYSTPAGTWAVGEGKADWATIVEKAINKTAADAVVTGDAIMADMTISLRTKETDRKAASSINVVKLAKSTASPTVGAVQLEVAPNTKKVTQASITVKPAEGQVIQYSLDGGVKWKKITGTKNLKQTITAEKGLLVRFAGDTKKVILPSLVTKFDVDYEAATFTGVAYDYDANGAIKEVNPTVK